jgi:hypothetical protein
MKIRGHAGWIFSIETQFDEGCFREMLQWATNNNLPTAPLLSIDKSTTDKEGICKKEGEIQ